MVKELKIKTTQGESCIQNREELSTNLFHGSSILRGDKLLLLHRRRGRKGSQLIDTSIELYKVGELEYLVGESGQFVPGHVQGDEDAGDGRLHVLLKDGVDPFRVYQVQLLVLPHDFQEMGLLLGAVVVGRLIVGGHLDALRVAE